MVYHATLAHDAAVQSAAGHELSTGSVPAPILPKMQAMRHATPPPTFSGRAESQQGWSTAKRPELSTATGTCPSVDFDVFQSVRWADAEIC